MLPCLAAVVAMLLGLGSAPAAAQPRPLIVSAASSLSLVMEQVAQAYRAATGVDVRVNTGGSNTLARQIVAGAGVDVFLSADPAQMDVADRAGRLVPGSRRDLLSNQLVLIVPEGLSSAVTGPRDLAASPARRIAMGNPDGVPAGVYGRLWLQRLGLWDAVGPKVVPLATVRQALAAVSAARADAGIVYATDVRAPARVKVVYTVPVDESPPIVYPVAAVQGGREADAARFLAWLQGEAAGAIFRRAGFGLVGQP